MSHQIVYVSPVSGHKYSIRYCHLFHHRHSNSFLDVFDTVWVHWTVQADFDNGSVDIEKGAEKSFFSKKLLKRRVASVVNTWEKAQGIA